ncbi:MAG: hypothetical protein ACRD1T_05555 [Acidimicrobiia bacterium]
MKASRKDREYWSKVAQASAELEETDPSYETPEKRARILAGF